MRETLATIGVVDSVDEKGVVGKAVEVTFLAANLRTAVLLAPAQARQIAEMLHSGADDCEEEPCSSISH